MINLFNVNDKTVKRLFVIGLLAIAFILRFINLGYSDYIPDETTVLYYLKQHQNFYSWEFFLEQRKGPVQFIAAYIPYFFTHDVFNQLAQRIPFALVKN